jgi:hypothetical protein
MMHARMITVNHQCVLSSCHLILRMLVAPIGFAPMTFRL